MIDWTPSLFFIFEIYLLATFIFILMENREPSSTISWMFVFAFFPVGGFILYILFGQNWRKTFWANPLPQSLSERFRHSLASLIDQQEAKAERLDEEWLEPNRKELMRLLYKSSDSLLTSFNRVQIFHDGESKFEALKADLRKAELFIHMEYFIWRSDKLGDEIKEILIQKVKEGVKVRILFDFLGSFFLTKKYIDALRRAGIEIYPFFNFLSVFKLHTLNYRNHRKIAVIDGKIGYTGGMNLGQEYCDGGDRFDYWRDTHLRLEGEAAALLQSVFLMDWCNTTRQQLFDAVYFPMPAPNTFAKELPIQISTSGPDSEWPTIKQLYFSLIIAADKSIFIQTPYFIPDPSILMALKTAALSGVDVRLMITGTPDKKLPFWSAFTFFEELLKAGAKIYLYQKGFLHSKTVVVDGELCSVGTANMDIRSFQLNYELNTLLYDVKISQQMDDAFLRDIQQSRELTLAEYGKLSHAVKFRNSLARLFAPLL